MTFAEQFQLHKRNMYLIRRLERVMGVPPLDMDTKARKEFIQRVTNSSSWDDVSAEDRRLIEAAESNFEANGDCESV